MDKLDKEMLKAISEAVVAVFSFGSMILTIALLWYRSRDKKANADTLTVIRTHLETLTQGYNSNVSHEQADKILEAVYTNMGHVLNCWLCSYIREGKPVMTPGKWNLELVIKAEYLLIKDKLGVFKYNGANMGDLVNKKSFDKLCEDVTDQVKTFDNTEGVSKYLTNKVDGLKLEVKEKLQ